jgi:hypothetical protein
LLLPRLSNKQTSILASFDKNLEKTFDPDIQIGIHNQQKVAWERANGNMPEFINLSEASHQHQCTFQPFHDEARPNKSANHKVMNKKES